MWFWSIIHLYIFNPSFVLNSALDTIGEVKDGIVPVITQL